MVNNFDPFDRVEKRATEDSIGNGNYHLKQGSQTQIDRRAIFQRKMLRGPQLNKKKAFTGTKLPEKLWK
jgi:hypothetical protein